MRGTTIGLFLVILVCVIVGVVSWTRLAEQPVPETVQPVRETAPVAAPPPVIEVVPPAAAPAFQPWPEQAPVFAPLHSNSLGWTILAEPADGAGCVLPAELADAARWPAAGPWTAVVRLEAGQDGRINHLFVMPPAPETGVTARLTALLRKARLAGPARECRIKNSRVEAPVVRNAEGAEP